MNFDYKKEEKALYQPSQAPGLIEVPPIAYMAVQGSGDPNQADGAFQQAVSQLYAVAYTIKMSPKGAHPLKGYFPYVVPPLEGLWQQAGQREIDYQHKEAFQWIAMIRLPEFADEEVLHWAVQEASRKKKQDLSAVHYFLYDEGLCVQCMHLGSYDDEPRTLATLHHYTEQQGLTPALEGARFHHEIYLSDPRKCAPQRLRTVIRIPVAGRPCST